MSVWLLGPRPPGIEACPAPDMTGVGQAKISYDRIISSQCRLQGSDIWGRIPETWEAGPEPGSSPVYLCTPAEHVQVHPSQHSWAAAGSLFMQIK